MDTTTAEIKDGKPFNKRGEEIIKCGLCGWPTTAHGTKRCDRCWELEGRIQRDPELARKVLVAMEKPERPHEAVSLRIEVDANRDRAFAEGFEKAFRDGAKVPLELMGRTYAMKVAGRDHGSRGPLLFIATYELRNVNE
jgi:hypothetical protein